MSDEQKPKRRLSMKCETGKFTKPTRILFQGRPVKPEGELKDWMCDLLAKAGAHKEAQAKGNVEIVWKCDKCGQGPATYFYRREGYCKECWEAPE